MPKRKPTGTFTIGAGFSTDDGFAAIAKIEQPKLFGTDKGLSLTATISERRQEFVTRYEDPTLFDTNLRLRGDLYNRSRLYTNFKREAAGGELSLTKRIAPNLDVFVGYKLEHVEATPGATSLFRGGATPEVRRIRAPRTRTAAPGPHPTRGSSAGHPGTRRATPACRAQRPGPGTSAVTADGPDPDATQPCDRYLRVRPLSPRTGAPTM